MLNFTQTACKQEVSDIHLMPFITRKKDSSQLRQYFFC